MIEQNAHLINDHFKHKRISVALKTAEIFNFKDLGKILCFFFFLPQLRALSQSSFEI